jgi:hypothetical protein
VVQSCLAIYLTRLPYVYLGRKRVEVALGPCEFIIIEHGTVAAARRRGPGAGSMRRRAGRRSARRITPVRAVLAAGLRRPGDQLSEGSGPVPVFAKQAGQSPEDREGEPQNPGVVRAGLDQPAEEQQGLGDRAQSH